MMTLIRKLLKLDQNDQEIAQIQDRALSQIDQATAIMKRAGRMREIMIRKTTTYYIARAMGVIK